MRKEKKIKIFLGLTYILIIISFLWAFFDKFSLNEFTSPLSSHDLWKRFDWKHYNNYK